MIAYIYPYQLIIGPAFTLFLAVALVFLLKFPSRKGWISLILLLGTLGEYLFFMRTGGAFLWGVYLFLATLLLGISTGIWATLTILYENRPYASEFNPPPRHIPHKQALKKSAYLLLGIVIISSALLISARATNLIQEDYRSIVNFSGEPSPNLTLKGTVVSFELNREVTAGYGYHIFPAYLTLNVTEVVWSTDPWRNQTIANQTFFGQSLIVYYDKPDVPSLKVGQQVEATGFYCPWYEDYLYSDVLVVSSNVNGSYIKDL